MLGYKNGSEILVYCSCIRGVFRYGDKDDMVKMLYPGSNVSTISKYGGDLDTVIKGSEMADYKTPDTTAAADKDQSLHSSDTAVRKFDLLQRPFT